MANNTTEQMLETILTTDSIRNSLYSLSSRLLQLEENTYHRNNLAFYNDFQHIGKLLEENDFHVLNNLKDVGLALEEAVGPINIAYNLIKKRIKLPEA